MNSLDLYYKSLGIDLIPYSRDENDYNQLPIIISEWKSILEKESSITSDNIRKLKGLISGGETKFTEICQFIKNEKYLQDAFFKELATVDNIDNWIISIINSSLYESALNNVCNEESIHIIDNILRLFIYYIKHYNGIDVLEQIKTAIKNIINMVCNDAKLIQSIHMSVSIIDILSSFDECILNTNKLEQLLNLIHQESENNFNLLIHVLSENIKQIKEWDENSLNYLFHVFVSKFDFNERGSAAYWYKSFYENIFPNIIEKLSDDSFDCLVKWIEEVEKQNKFAFMRYGSFCVDYKNIIHLLYNPITIVLSMIKDIIDEGNIDTKRFLLEKMNQDNFDNNCSMIQKICFYMVASDYELNKDFLFKFFKNPFSIWNVYGDLYYVIEKNNSLISEKEAQILKSWILNSNYENKSDEYQKCLKYDFLNLLSKEHKDFNQDKMKLYSDSFDEYDDIYDRNISLKIGECTGLDNKDIKEHLSKLSFDEIVEYFDDLTISGWNTEYDYTDALESIFDNDTSIISNNVSKICNLPDWCFVSVIDHFKTMHECYDNKMIIDILNMIIDKLSVVPKNEQTYISLIELLNSEYLNDKTNYDILLLVEKTIIKLLTKTKDLFERAEYSENETIDTITFIINNWFCKGVHCLLHISLLYSNKHKKNSIISDIYNYYKNAAGDYKNILKYCLLHSFSIIIQADKFLSDEMVEELVDDFTSAELLVYSGVRNKEIYIKLKDIGYFNHVFENGQSSDEYIMGTFAYWSVECYLDYGIDSLDDIKTIICCQRSDVIYYVFNQLSYRISKGANKNLIRSLLRRVCKMTIESMELSNLNNTDQILRYLADCIYQLKSADKGLWDCLKLLSKNFDSYLSDELIVLLKSYYKSQKNYVIDIIKNIVENTKWPSYIFDDDKCKELILMIKEDNDAEKSFNSINSTFIQRGYCEFV